MTWARIARQEHSRKGLRYPSDMTDRKWLLTAPFIPFAKSGDRKRTSDMREVVNAVLLRRLEWLCVADAAKTLSASLDRAPLFLCLARHRAVREHQNRAGHEPAPDRGANLVQLGRQKRRLVRPAEGPNEAGPVIKRPAVC